MRKRRQIELFSLSFLDLISGALGAVIILYVAIPKNKPTPVPEAPKVIDRTQEVATLTSKLEELKKQNQSLESQLAEATKPVPKEPVADMDIGFKFRGKKLSSSSIPRTR
jgi:hypothetical protein